MADWRAVTLDELGKIFDDFGIDADFHSTVRGRNNTNVLQVSVPMGRMKLARNIMEQCELPMGVMWIVIGEQR